MTTKEVLIAARKRIENPERWAKGAALVCNPEKNVDCAGYAILRVEGTEYPERTNAFETFTDAVYQDRYTHVPGVIRNTIAAWNDAPERTHAEVLAAFDRAIELADGQ